MRISKLLSVSFLLVVLFWLSSGAVFARKPFNAKSLGGFEHFVDAVHDARDASLAGDKELEQKCLKKAGKILDSLDMDPSLALVRQDFRNIQIQHSFGRVHGKRSEKLEKFYQGLCIGVEGGLYEHLHDAIVSHESRMPYYASKTGGKSDPIFRKIATLQRLNLPVSWYIDVMARRFQKNGIPVIIADLVNMDTIFPKEQPPFYRGVMPKDVLQKVRSEVKAFQKSAMAAVNRGKFHEVAKLTHEIVEVVKRFEKQHNAHLAMTVHMLDSIGYTALHAADYQKRTNGDTDVLCRKFLMIQIFPMQECLPTDHRAQALHAMGVGVIVNDVPDIPFASEWQKASHQQD